MKVCLSAVLASILLAGFALQATAQGAGAQKSAEDRASQFDKRLLTDLRLTKAQEAPVGEALAAYRRDDAAWQVKNAPEMTRLRKQMGRYHSARDANTLAEVKAAMRKMAKLRAERAAIKQALTTRLKELLTEQQFVNAQAALNPRRPSDSSANKFHYLGKLGLTKKQLGRIRKIMDQARKSNSATPTGKPTGNPMQQAWAKIVKEVLTDKDREKLRDLMQKASHRRMVMAMFRNVPLTREQAAKVDAIWNRAYEDAKKKPNAKFTIYSQARRKAIEEVLTPEQRKQLPGAAGRKTRMPHPMPGMGAPGEKGKAPAGR